MSPMGEWAKRMELVDVIACIELLRIELRKTQDKSMATQEYEIAKRMRDALDSLRTMQQKIECNDYDPAKCMCFECSPMDRRRSVMIVCPTCGNKRCPHATHHSNTCTFSNDPGQPGSRY